MKWHVRAANEAQVQKLADELGLPRAIARVLWLRGYETPAIAQGFLASRKTLDFLKEPVATPGMERAVARIRQAVASGEPMVIYGDYDCDGVTSSTLLYRYLARGMKANARAYLPDRFKDGYGVTPQAVQRLASEGVRLIVTCDNGISAHAAASAAAACGIDLVVTDHHQVPDVLPAAAAIVHPQLEFPHLRDLAGVGVAYLLTLALEGAFTARMEHFLDLVAIGTVADMVPLNGPNRPLVWAGIERIRSGKMLPGVRQLGEVAKVRWEDFSPQHIGFRFGPRLNAAGRLETPDVGFRMLATNDAAEAAALAEALDAINTQRRDLNAELEQEVLSRIEREWDLDAEPFIVLADETYHHGLTGIVAGRVKERFRVPVLLFSRHDQAVWKASGRSPEGLHLYEALHACREHLLGFGGHAQAAGCSTTEAGLAPLRRALNQYVIETGWQRPADLVWLDAELPFDEANERLLSYLDDLEPFGQKNPAPVFGLHRARLLGIKQRGKRVGLQVDDGCHVREVIVWRPEAETPHEIERSGPGWIHLAYQPELNVWKGTRSLQLMAKRVDPADAPPPIEIRTVTLRLAEVSDCRGMDPIDWLEALPTGAACSIYANVPDVAYLEPPLRAALERRSAVLVGPSRGLEQAKGRLLCIDLPLDESTWLTLRERVESVAMGWSSASDLPDLTPEWLCQFYERLAESPQAPLPDLAYRACPECPLLGLEALGIFRDAGLLAQRGLEWSLLAARPETIALAHLPAFQRIQEARAFRRRLAETGRSVSESSVRSL